MGDNIHYVHTNLIAKDWNKLADFYINVFGCKPTYPERHLSGEWIDKLTNIDDVRIDGIHLQLPGYENNGPTLEIFEYNKKKSDLSQTQINNFGFSHIAFHVDDLEKVLKKVIDSGGQKYGEMVKKDMPKLGTITVVYVRDPEGNIIELQNWKK